MARSSKPRGERFVSRPGDSVFVKPGEQPPRPRARGAAAIALTDVRRARKVTQIELAGAMGVDQAQISRLERRGDFRLSTVLEYLEGLGVEDVELRLTFNDGTEMVLPVAAGEKR